MPPRPQPLYSTIGARLRSHRAGPRPAPNVAKEVETPAPVPGETARQRDPRPSSVAGIAVKSRQNFRQVSPEPPSNTPESASGRTSPGLPSDNRWMRMRIRDRACLSRSFRNQVSYASVWRTSITGRLYPTRYKIATCRHRSRMPRSAPPRQSGRVGRQMAAAADGVRAPGLPRPPGRTALAHDSLCPGDSSGEPPARRETGKATLRERRLRPGSAGLAAAQRPSRPRRPRDPPRAPLYPAGGGSRAEPVRGLW